MLIFFFLFVASVGCTIAGKPIFGYNVSVDIVNGIDVSINKFPYQVSLQYGNFHGCGGALISKKHVITAAHCLKSNPSVKKLKVRLGSSSWKKNGILVQVKFFKIHPDYSSQTHNMDVAVVELKTPVTPDGKSIKIIELSGEEPTADTDVIVTGWGATKRGEFEYQEPLRKIDLKIVSREFCKSKYNYGTDILDSMICAFADNRDTCVGDSGGPMVADEKLIGIVSWGVGCAILAYPGVYTKVAHVKNWIEQNTK